MKKRWIIPVVAAAILAAAAITFTKGFLHMENADADISIGRVLLTEQSELTVEDVSAQINEVQSVREEEARLQREAEEEALRLQHEAEAAAQAEADAAQQAIYFQQWCDEADAIAEADQFKGIFANSVVIGDSIAYGILTTDLMLPTSVVAEIGVNLVDLLDYLPQVQSLNPHNIFLYCGFNDIGMCMGDTDKYYSDFVTFVTQLQAVCPGVPIYVNHLVPVQNIDTLENSLYLEVDLYNSIIDQIASEYGLGIVENADLIREEYYYKDGYHMTYPYYPKWLRRMAETAGLM